MGYGANSSVVLTGYLIFGESVNPIKMTATIVGDAYTGGGNWGSTEGCAFTAKMRGDPMPAPPNPPAKPVTGKWDLKVSCPGGSGFTRYSIEFVDGRSAGGFTYTGGTSHGIWEAALGYENNGSIRITGFSFFPPNTTSKFDLTATDITQAPGYVNQGPGVLPTNTSFSGGGTMGSQTSCAFTANRK
jgi:hypothetical protein